MVEQKVVLIPRDEYYNILGKKRIADDSFKYFYPN